MLKQKSTSGFTIVELVIVIVVIGILASITIVAYNGVQGRAKNVQFLSAFDTYEKSLRQYKTFEGHYPYTTATPNTSAMAVCLGEYPKSTNGISPNRCAKIDWGGETTQNYPVMESVNDNILTVINSLPTVPDTTTTISADGISMTIRGIIYFPKKGAQEATLSYYVEGDQTCGRGQKVTDNSAGVAYTACQVTVN